MSLQNVLGSAPCLVSTPAQKNSHIGIRPKGVLQDNVNWCMRLTQFNSYKFITLRPSICFILGRYFVNKIPTALEYSRLLLDKVLEVINNIPDIKLIGGVFEKNDNDPFTHFHFILRCSNKTYEIFKKHLLPLVDVYHTFNKVQHALKISKCVDGNIMKMIYYYRGMIENPKYKEQLKWKPSALYLTYGPSSDDAPVSIITHSMLLEAYETQLFNRKAKSVKKKILAEYKGNQLYETKKHFKEVLKNL